MANKTVCACMIKCSFNILILTGTIQQSRQCRNKATQISFQEGDVEGNIENVFFHQGAIAYNSPILHNGCSVTAN